MDRIFITYVREDIETARKLYNDLKKSKLDLWFDKENLSAGQNWKEEIRKAIQESSFILALLSSNSISKKGYYQKELKIAFDIKDEYPTSKEFIIPVRLEHCNPIDERIKELHRIDLFPSYENGLEEILKALNKPESSIKSDRSCPNTGTGFTSDTKNNFISQRILDNKIIAIIVIVAIPIIVFGTFANIPEFIKETFFKNESPAIIATLPSQNSPVPSHEDEPIPIHKTTVFVIDKENGINWNISHKIISILKTEGISARASSLLTDALVSDGTFERIFRGDAGQIKKLGSKNFGHMIFGKKSVSFVDNPDMQNMITATAFVEIHIVSSKTGTIEDSFTISQKGPGFSKADAEEIAMERIVKQIGEKIAEKMK